MKPDRIFSRPKRTKGNLERKILVLIAGFVLAGSGAAFAAQKAHKVIKGLDNVYILKSSDKKHGVLLEGCRACHADSDYKFWMLIYRGEGPRIEAVVEGKHSGAEGKPGYLQASRIGTWDFPNSHDYFECAFCHLGTPGPGEEKVSFVMPAGDLCALCHPGKKILHRYKETTSVPPVQIDKLLEHGLPTEDGKVQCLTCHQTHNALQSVRPSYIKAELEERVVDPHGSKVYCLLCHEGKLDDPSAVAFKREGDFIALCTGCHDAHEAEEHHPVKVAPDDETWKMDFISFPLQDGMLSCVTCHDEPCYLPRDYSNEGFLRGGPYFTKSEFCYRCHAEDKTDAFNPHRQVSGVGLIMEETCLFCHMAVPDRETGLTATTELREETISLCQKCHQETRPHPVVNHMVRLRSEMEPKKLAYENKHKVVLPLEEGNMIVCNTCHNAHGKGVLKGDMGVGAGELFSLRLPDFREVCVPCHGRY